MRKPGSATTSVASASFGADAHTNHESVASRGLKRRGAAKETTVGPGGTNPVGVVHVGSVGQPAATRTAGVVRPTEPEYPRVECSCGAGSDQATGSAAAHDASGCGFADGTGLRVDRGDTATICWLLRRNCAGRFTFGKKSLAPKSTNQRRYIEALETYDMVFAIGPGGTGKTYLAGGKQIASYVGLVPTEESSRGRRRLGHISKQGNSLSRFLLVEAAQATVRSDPDWRRKFLHLAMRRERRIAKVAMARKLAVRLYWMWRKEWDYEQVKRFGSHAGQPGDPLGVQ